MNDVDQDMPVLILNNTGMSNTEVNNNFGNSTCIKKDIFDKDSLISHTHSFNNPDEIKNYDGENLWLNFWYITQESPYQLSIRPEDLDNHYWFKNKLFNYASKYRYIKFILLTYKSVVDAVYNKISSNTTDEQITEKLTYQIKFQQSIEPYLINEIVYIDSDSDVKDELYEKIVNIYNDIK